MPLYCAQEEDDFVPVGTGALWFTATPPTDWLILNGSTFDALDFPELNTLLGGNMLPDLRDVFPLGAGSLTALGATGGVFDHHHTQPLHIHSQTHNHIVDPPLTVSSAAPSQIVGIIPLNTVAAPAGHTHTTDIPPFNSNPDSTDTNPAGAEDTGTSKPPFLTVNFIIKAR